MSQVELTLLAVAGTVLLLYLLREYILFAAAFLFAHLVKFLFNNSKKGGMK